jgi:F-type H+-transporting ATPase subunit alpha
MTQAGSDLQAVLDQTFAGLEHVTKTHRAILSPRDIGTVRFVGRGIALVAGLPTVKSEELVGFEDGSLGMAFNLDSDQLGVILLDESDELAAGHRVYRTGRVLDVPVGKSLLGRVVDAVGRPVDEKGPVRDTQRRPIEREAPSLMDRAPVSVPLQTGIKVVDALIPVGRGQRELIVGDRQTGKTAITIDTIINQRETDVVCVYCAIGKRESSVMKVIHDLAQHEAMEYCIILVASGEDPPAMQFAAAYSATTMAEYFAEQGQDVLIVYDDLTRHARAYRELSLLLRRPPGREAYPGDIFYIHSRLLERSTQFREERGGGSLTALPIVETQAQNISAYIPTNLISITDGQIYLSPVLFQKGLLPAVDVGRSVSRVGGKAQLAAYREVAGDLRLSYSQFEELEVFSRFGTRLEEQTRRQLERGRRVREILKQSQYSPVAVPEQIAILLAVNEGLLDDVPVDQMEEAENRLQGAVREKLPDVCQRIEEGRRVEQEQRKALLDVANEAISRPGPVD